MFIHYSKKFYEDILESRWNMDKINDMYMKHADKTELDSIFQKAKIKRLLAEFPFESTYGHDLILP